MLYHYTSQQGLLGILRSRSIWASSVRFLNDYSEFYHALRHAREIAWQYFHEQEDYLEYFGFLLQRSIGNIRPGNVFVSSFSEKPDLLSQWRGYCPEGNGFCLGFDRVLLEKYCQEKGIILAKCLYGGESQNEEVKSVIASGVAIFPGMKLTYAEFSKLSIKDKLIALEDYRKEIDGPFAEQADEALSVIRESLIEMAPRFKHQGFHEEAEWRIIAGDMNGPIEFRSGSSYLIPYISLSVLLDNAPMLREVIVGPNPNQDRASASLKMALDHSGFGSAKVTLSKVPFNNW